MYTSQSIHTRPFLTYAGLCSCVYVSLCMYTSLYVCIGLFSYMYPSVRQGVWRYLAVGLISCVYVSLCMCRSLFIYMSLFWHTQISFTRISQEWESEGVLLWDSCDVSMSLFICVCLFPCVHVSFHTRMSLFICVCLFSYIWVCWVGRNLLRVSSHI